MCDRFALYSDPFSLARRFQAEALPELRPRYNVAPTQSIPIMREEGGNRRFALARWGLIPQWAKDMKIGYHTINARAETVAEKPAFRNAFRHRRCLIPADGYFEWQVVPGFQGQATVVYRAEGPRTDGVCRAMGTLAEPGRRGTGELLHHRDGCE